MSPSFDLDPVEWITASSIGPPGNRTFYLRARKDGEYVALVVEKSQIRSFADLAQRLLADAGVTIVPDDVDSALELHGPVQPAWRAGQMSLGTDEAAEIFVLEAVELVTLEPGTDPESIAADDIEPATARFVMNREQMTAMTAFAAFAVEHGGRERCQVCEGLRDPLAGCMGCPLTNGSGPKRI